MAAPAPDKKSIKTLPSTSVIVAPSPYSGTTGNNFTPDPLEIYLRSNSTYFCAFGPGGVTCMFGIFNLSSSKCFYFLCYAKVGVTLIFCATQKSELLCYKWLSLFRQYMLPII